MPINRLANKTNQLGLACICLKECYFFLLVFHCRCDPIVRHPLHGYIWLKNNVVRKRRCVAEYVGYKRSKTFLACSGLAVIVTFTPSGGRSAFVFCSSTICGTERRFSRDVEIRLILALLSFLLAVSGNFKALNLDISLWSGRLHAWSLGSHHVCRSYFLLNAQL